MKTTAIKHAEARRQLTRFLHELQFRVVFPGLGAEELAADMDALLRTYTIADPDVPALAGGIAGVVTYPDYGHEVAANLRFAWEMSQAADEPLCQIYIAAALLIPINHMLDADERADKVLICLAEAAGRLLEYLVVQERNPLGPPSALRGFLSSPKLWEILARTSARKFAYTAQTGLPARPTR